MAVTPFLQQAPCVAQGDACLFLLATATELRHGTLEAAIGDAVLLDWEERADAPPLPVFRLA